MEQAKLDDPNEEYAQSNVPAPLNLLEPFAYDPALDGARPQLPALRLMKVSPVTPASQDSPRSLKSSARRLYPAAPAILSRVRFSRLSSTKVDTADTLIAAVDFEATPFAGCDLRLDHVELALSHGSIELCAGDNNLPIICKPGDEFTMLYFLTPSHCSVGSTEGPKKHQTLEIKGTARVLFSEDCSPEVRISWKASVEFSDQKGFGSGVTDISIIRPSNQRQSQMSEAPRPASNPSHKADITVTVSGPAHVYVGELFRWQVFIVNHSDKPRKLGIVAITKRARAGASKHTRKASTSSAEARKGRGDRSVADAVVDDYILHEMQKSGASEPDELVILSSDVRVG